MPTRLVMVALILATFLAACDEGSDQPNAGSQAEQSTASTASVTTTPVSAIPGPAPTSTPSSKRPPEPIGRIAFHEWLADSGTSVIRIATADGSAIETLAPPADKRDLYSPIWSPDGSSLFYAAVNPYPGALYLTSLESWATKEIAPVYSDDSGDSCESGPAVAVSPSGHLASVSGQGGVTVMTHASGDVVLANDTPGTAFSPSISQNGLFAFTAWASEDGGLFDGEEGCAVFIIDLASGARRFITRGYQPVISPDGKTIAFMRDQGLYLVNTDGSKVRPIVEAAANDYGYGWVAACDWSPDGTRLACNVPYNGDGNAWTPQATHIAVIDTASGHLFPLGEGVDATWSPDGEWLAYTGREKQYSGHQIYIRPANGYEDVRRIGPGESPEWSPTP